MKCIRFVPPLLAVLLAGPAQSDTTYRAERPYRSDDGPSSSYRHHHDRYGGYRYDDHPRGYGRYEERRPADRSGWRAPPVQSNPVFIAPQKKVIP